MNLPGHSPDFNTDETIWGWAREEATGNLCLGTKKLVQERVGNFSDGLAGRKEEVKRHCRTILQSRAEGLPRNPHTNPHHRPYAHPTLALLGLCTKASNHKSATIESVRRQLRMLS